MSVVTSILGSSAAANYSAQVTPTSALRRSLSSLGLAIQKGELVPASAILTAFFKANPQYTATATVDAPTPDPLSQSFQALATALANHQPDAAQTAWTQVKTNLAGDGVTYPSDSSTPESPAQTESSLEAPAVNIMSDESNGSEAAMSVLL